ncbi:MAG: RcnB family protein [Caulobacteraceae bacterium]
MKRIVLAALAASMVVAAPAAYAQPGRDHDRGDRHDHDRGDFHRHAEWRRGYHLQLNDWDRGERIDWRARHLRRPPRGYEWRQVDGNYVMAAVATGIIASVIANSR